MRRWVCVWLPRFRTDRLERTNRAGAAPHERPPLAVTASGKGGNRLIAVNAAAESVGLHPDMLLTDALAMEPGLAAIPQDEAGEAADLARLAAWCRRYSPWTAPDDDNGLWIDITGAAHLFGGEAALLGDLISRLQGAGFIARAASAGTHGAAWGMARYGPRNPAIIPPGGEARHLAPLSVRALNIPPAVSGLLERLGLRTVGALLDIPRDAIRARFGEVTGTRLDQALGAQGEARAALPYEPVFFSRLEFPEPFSTIDAILLAAEKLLADVTRQLERRGLGARRFTLLLFDCQGGWQEIDLRAARPGHDARHILRLFRERFAMLESRFDETLGFDAATLTARETEIMAAAQGALSAGERADDGPEALERLFDRLNARLGGGAVRHFRFAESHIPERASLTMPVLHKSAPGQPPAKAVAKAPRPLMLLPRPEPISVIAEVPDYPPRRFTWRHISHRVVKAEGPERIEPEWWRTGQYGLPPRDYYMVEDDAGCRFWVYREGFYAAGGAKPSWFLHGLFA